MKVAAGGLLALTLAMGAQNHALAAMKGGNKAPAPEDVQQVRMTAGSGQRERSSGRVADCDSASNDGVVDPWQARRDRYRAMVERAGERYGVEPALIDAVITVESGYKPRSVNSRTGAAGLMQLMPRTARRYKVTNVFDPSQNVRAGARYLAELLETFDNDPQLALAAYLAGEGAVQKYGRIPPYRAAQRYVPKVIRYYRKFQCATYTASADGVT